MCRAKESSGDSTAAIPPWARLVAVSTLAFLVMMVTDPKRAALMAKESPEMPLPITRKSVLCFMATPVTAQQHHICFAAALLSSACSCAIAHFTDLFCASAALLDSYIFLFRPIPASSWIVA